MYVTVKAVEHFFNGFKDQTISEVICVIMNSMYVYCLVTVQVISNASGYLVRI